MLVPLVLEVLAVNRQPRLFSLRKGLLNCTLTIPLALLTIKPFKRLVVRTVHTYHIQRLYIRFFEVYS